MSVFLIIFIERDALLLVFYGQIRGSFGVCMISVGVGCDVLLIYSRITLF